MRIFIRVEEQVPNTTYYCVEERQIDPDAVEMCKFDLIGEELTRMKANVSEAVKKQTG